MSRIDDMVRELCPDGFERVSLGSVATQYVEPVRVQPDATYVNLGVRWYGEGAFAREPKAGKDIKGATLYRVKSGQFIYNRMFVTEGAFGLVTQDLSSGVVSNEFPVYDLDPTRVLPDWLLLKFQDPSTVRAVAAETTGGTKSRRRWKEDQFEAFVIDLPPIPVQREIVRILSTFSELETELKAELELRLLQYAHYRDSLLAFFETGTRWALLGEIANVRVGQAPPEGVVSGEGPFAFVNAGTTESGRASEANTQGGAVTIPSRGQGGVGVVGYQAEDFWCGPLCYRIASVNAGLSTRFLYYYLKSVQPSIRRLQQTGGTPALNRKELILVKVPIPPAREQERIVGILDKFDPFLNDLSVGLPAEINARRKQYEHYRDRLLAFNELAA